jgi:hypothetical protein
MMRKHTFLIATAVAALTLGSGAAFGQQSEKAAPSGGAGAHSGTVPSHSAAPANRMGQSQAGEHNRMGEGQNKRSQTTGQAPSEQPGMQKTSPKAERHEGNRAQRPNEAAKPNERNANEHNERNRGTNGQAPSERNGQGATVNERSNTNANERNGANANEHNTNERNGASARGGSHTTVNLSSEQRTRIHTIIVSEKSAPRVAHVDFDVRVGTRVPRDRVHLVAVPSSIIEIAPSWRGFEYFLVGNEIVVVDPASLEIVAVLPA